MFKIIFFFIFSSLYLYATPYTLDDTEDVYLSYYEDRSSTKTLLDIEQLPDSSFIPFSSTAMTHFFSDSTFWYKVKILNTSKKLNKQTLLLSAPWLNSVDFFIYSPQKRLSQYKQGILEDFDVRFHKENKINITYKFEPGVSQLYMRVHTLDPIVVKLTILSMEKYFKSELSYQKYRGILFGIIIAMMIYNFTLFISTRRKLYGSYVLYLSFFVLMVASYNGYLYMYFLESSPLLNRGLIPVYMILYMSLGIVFAQNFLELKVNYLKLYKQSQKMILFIIIIPFLLYMIGSYHYMIVGTIVMTTLFSGFMFYLGFVVWLKHHYWASYYLLATTAGSIGTLLTALSVMSIVEYNEFTYKGVEIGIVVDSLLLSIALAERMRIVDKEKFEIQKQINIEIQKNKQKDEKLIAQSRMAQMGEMISIIAHQWRQPLGAISATCANIRIKLELDLLDFSTQEKKKESLNFFMEKLSNVNHYVQELTTTIDDFRNFYKPNRKKTSTTMKSIVEKSISVIGSSLADDGIEVSIDYSQLQEIVVHEHELMQVLLNILKNAHDNFLQKKITDAKIFISVKEKSIQVLDNGGGINEEIMSHIFDPYFSTKDEKNGTGLGLYMSKTIVEEHHQGVLLVRNVDDGVCFEISL